MHVRLLCVDKIRDHHLRGVIDALLQRLRPYHRIEEVELRPTDGSNPQRAIVGDSLAVLGKLTYLHEWSRALLLEQLYRAARINTNAPYHH